jgi:peptidoglycan/xylan/chitin deacetylase (PgdA/CDA1 family)
MLKLAKQLTLASAQALGVYEGFRRSGWRRRRLLILGYHGLSQVDEHLWRAGLYMPASLFAERMEAISRMGCAVLPLDEALARLQAGTLPPMAVVLTFDDGFYNFYKVAHPILKRFGFPATIYQTTYYAGWNRPIFNLASSYLFWRGSGKIVDSEPITGQVGSFDLQSEESRDLARNRLIEFARTEGLSPADRQQLLKKVADAVGASYQEIMEKRLFNLMTYEELSEMVREGVDIQLHTHRHRVPQTREAFIKELEDNQRALAAIGQPQARHFTYPSGVYRPEVFPWLAEFGVRSATTCETGLVTTKANLLCAPRFIDAPEVSQREFDAWLCGLRELLPGRSVASGAYRR